MKTTANWLNEYLDRPAEVDEIVKALGDLGFGCEGRLETPDGDTQLDFETTSNRGDCVSVVGLAREVAATTERRLVPPSFESRAVDEPAADSIRVENTELDLCPYYSARVIRGVSIAPSPRWLRDRMESVGLRPVNNVVDVTNFVLYELGQPLHAFDLAKVSGGQIVIRRARPGETMTSLDNKRLILDDSMLVIADAQAPLAVAGIMGSLNSEVSAPTRDILLEAAVFKAAPIRRTSRTLKLMSDSSYRFERGIHPATVSHAAERAAQLIVEIAGGELLQGAVVAAAPIPEPIVVSMRPQRCRAIAGYDLPTTTMIRNLQGLGIAVENSSATAGEAARDEQSLVCRIPYHRLDLTREIDLIEEVVRVSGFDEICTLSRLCIEVQGPQSSVVNRRRVDETLAACGFHEVVSYSFVSRKDAEAFLPAGFGLLRVRDDRRKAEPVLRPSILPSLLGCRKRNQDAGHKAVRLFEQAACYGILDGEKVERENLALILDASDPQEGLRILRGTLDEAIRVLLGPGAAIAVRPLEIPWYEADAAAGLLLDGEVLGTIGVIHESIRKRFDLDLPVAAAEIGLPGYYSNIEPLQTEVEPPGMRPSIERDLSILIDDTIAWSKIRDVVDESELPCLQRLEFVGVYRGRQIGSGRKSVTMRLVFRNPDRTLCHEDVDPAITDLVSRLTSEIGAVLR